MANLAYNRGKRIILDSSLDLVSDTLKVMLVDSDYVPNADHNVVDDGVSGVTARPGQQEVTGTNYAPGFAGAGRKTVASPTITQDDTNDRAKFTAANIVWTAVDGFTAASAILYKHITNDATSPLIGKFDGGFPKTANGGDLNFNWHATDGVLTLT